MYHLSARTVALEVLREYSAPGKPLSTKEVYFIAKHELGYRTVTYDAIRVALLRLRGRGPVERPYRGHYFFVPEKNTLQPPREQKRTLSGGLQPFSGSRKTLYDFENEGCKRTCNLSGGEVAPPLYARFLNYLNSIFIRYRKVSYSFIRRWLLEHGMEISVGTLKSYLARAVQRDNLLKRVGRGLYVLNISQEAFARVVSMRLRGLPPGGSATLVATAREHEGEGATSREHPGGGRSPLIRPDDFFALTRNPFRGHGKAVPLPEEEAERVMAELRKLTNQYTPPNPRDPGMNQTFTTSHCKYKFSYNRKKRLWKLEVMPLGRKVLDEWCRLFSPSTYDRVITAVTSECPEDIRLILRYLPREIRGEHVTILFNYSDYGGDVEIAGTPMAQAVARQFTLEELEELYRLHEAKQKAKVIVGMMEHVREKTDYFMSVEQKLNTLSAFVFELKRELEALRIARGAVPADVERRLRDMEREIKELKEAVGGLKTDMETWGEIIDAVRTIAEYVKMKESVAAVLEGGGGGYYA